MKQISEEIGLNDEYYRSSIEHFRYNPLMIFHRTKKKLWKTKVKRKLNHA